MTTGHEGFDFWKDEFTAKIKEIEEALHGNNGNENRGVKPQTSTNDLTHQATSILKNVWIEAKGVSWQKDPALRQEMMDIYKACQMQLETYIMLSDQHGDDYFGGDDQAEKASGNTTKRTAAKNPPSHTRTTAKSEDPTPLWDQQTIDNSNYNSKHASIQEKTQGRVSKQNSRLKDALRSVREMEEIGQEITGELDAQRSTLESTQGHMHSMKDMMQQSKGLLKSMNKQWWRKW